MLSLFQDPLFTALGWALASSIWQCGILWVVYLVCVNVKKDSGPNFKHNLAFSLIGTGFIWFCIGFFKKYAHAEVGGNYISMTTTGGVNIFQVLLPYVSVAYLFVLSWLSFRLFVSYFKARSLSTKGLLPGLEHWNDAVIRYTASLGIFKTVKIYISAHISVPATLHYFKPVILIPMAAVNQLTVKQMESVILHELAHIKRNDYLINLLVAVVETLMFFNPFIVLLIETIKKERENCCDDVVLHYKHDPHHYASALLSLEQLRMNAFQLAIPVTGNGQLLTRVKRIMNVRQQRIHYRNKLLALLVVTFVMAGLACIAPHKAERKIGDIVTTEDAVYKTGGDTLTFIQPVAALNPLQRIAIKPPLQVKAVARDAVSGLKTTTVSNVEKKQEPVAHPLPSHQTNELQLSNIQVLLDIQKEVYEEQRKAYNLSIQMNDQFAYDIANEVLASLNDEMKALVKNNVEVLKMAEGEFKEKGKMIEQQQNAIRLNDAFVITFNKNSTSLLLKQKNEEKVKSSPAKTIPKTKKLNVAVI